MTANFHYLRLAGLLMRMQTRSSPGAILVLAVILLCPVAVLGWEPGTGNAVTEAAPALGMNDSFGRWTTTVKLVYDPDNAPPKYTDPDKVQQLLMEAAAEWELVSGIRFTMVGVDASAPDDDNLFGPRDGLVRVYWGNTQGAAALAGPSFGDYDSDLGYYPYDDGSVVLSTDNEIWKTDDFFVSTLTHELGHLLGLGHSDNPQSLMYANPYTFLNHPRQDDIQAIQVLYGSPAVAIDPALPQARWVYSPPPVASKAAVDAVFKPNSLDPQSVHMALGAATVSSITAQSSDNEFVFFNPGGYGGGGVALNRQLTVIGVDPFGYVYTRRPLTLMCSAGSVCGGGGVSIALGLLMKSMPGNWSIYVVDEEQNVTLASLELPVETTVSYNLPPTGSASVVAGSTPSSATFTITATDPENNPVTVVWHGPGVVDLNGDQILDSDIRDPLDAGGKASRSFNFSQAGTHTLFVSLIDDQVRYNKNAAGFSTAGRGFQTLLRLQVSLPVTDPVTALTVVSSAITTVAPDACNPVSRAVLAQVSSTTASQQNATTKTTGSAGFSASTASFRLGASRDQGSTTGVNFQVGDQVVIAGNAVPQGADVGQPANIFLVIRTQTATEDRWTYRDLDGVFRPWNGNIPDLQPAFVVDALKSSEDFEIYQGILASAAHKVYIGYRLTGGNVLHFTSNPMRLEVGQ